MANLLRSLWMMICLVFVSPSLADEARLQSLITQAKAAIERDDYEETERIGNEIYALTTGLDPSGDGEASNLSKADYQKRVCPYRKAIAPFRTHQDVKHRLHQKRVSALRIVGEHEENSPYVLATLECVQDNGEPVLEALALKKGIEWAQKLYAADTAGTQKIIQEYEELIRKHPNNQLYPLIKEAINRHIEKRHRDEKFQRYMESRLFQEKLVEKAHKGNLSAQLEVARRLETGDKFKQSHHYAYFWYIRASQNGGGEVAQSGLDRLLPHLDEIDLMRVDNWIKKKYSFY